MLQNAYLLAKIGADTAENEQHFARCSASRRAAASSTDGVLPGAARGELLALLLDLAPSTLEIGFC